MRKEHDFLGELEVALYHRIGNGEKSLCIG